MCCKPHQTFHAQQRSGESMHSPKQGTSEIARTFAGDLIPQVQLCFGR